ncbi:hypothetical protein OG599_15420 [Streptomyces sp. NBC_01335]|uniref:hypothetical protein n=1 Tax=Streptomyces sp. NBC_01335 TaxID=2903828 RepID=UPI002E101785|nr:hypothetical protein OG599_15420 [Streptomyces sp. NBC_01335]
MIATMITALASVLIAVLAYALNQRGEIRRSKRQAHLDRINSQLRDLYGPLLILVEANERTWDAFRERHLTPIEERRGAAGLTEEQSRLWRRWVLTVLAPTARQMRDVVLANGDLFIEDEIPQLILDFCAHVSSYEVTIVEWEAGEDGAVLVRHPGAGLARYIRDAYRSLKSAQAEVLRAQA